MCHFIKKKERNLLGSEFPKTQEFLCFHISQAVEVYMIILSCWTLERLLTLSLGPSFLRQGDPLRFSLIFGTAFIAFQELIDKTGVLDKHLMWDECVSVLVFSTSLFCTWTHNFLAYSYLAAA
ncbi:hypothetical protein ACJX0J_014780 [Zea mays]